MVVFLYSDKNYESISISCIRSLKNKISDDVKIVYYTIGFDSDFSFQNLTLHRIDANPIYPSFEFYKPELAMLTMDLFPDSHYLFVDSDVLFSKRFNFDMVKHDYPYPMASFGPHEYIYSWVCFNDEIIRFDENKLMQYFNVPERSQRYVFSCFFSFNSNCRDFLLEWYSMCTNKYLLEKRQDYHPFRDETSFNICLWKRGATENYGFAFVNTHVVSTIVEVELGASKRHFDNAVDDNGAALFSHLPQFGYKWEYVDDSSKVMLYHGIKNADAMNEALEYLLN